jgi:outer membrane immunogenic protein
MAQPNDVTHGIQLITFNRRRIEGLVMKRTLIAGALIAGAILGALGALGSAMAADMKAPAPMLMKAPMAPVASWTGCYVGVGAGYGMFDIDHNTVGEPPTTPGTLFHDTSTTGGRGWLGRVGIGCDYQIADRWLIGAFGDWDWSSIKGQHEFECPGGCASALPTENLVEIKQKWAWSAGGRVGYLVTPAFLTYFDAGFTSARFAQGNINDAGTGLFTGAIVPEHTFSGYFLGSGYEYALGFFPGVYWKTEYRFSDFGSKNVSLVCSSVTCVGGGVVLGGPLGISDHTHTYVQTVLTELTYRFNWH